MPQKDSSMELASKKGIVHIRLNRRRGGQKGQEEKSLSIFIFVLRD